MMRIEILSPIFYILGRWNCLWPILASTLFGRDGKSYRKSESITYVSCPMAEYNNIMSNVLTRIILIVVKISMAMVI